MRGKISATPKNKNSSPSTTARGQLFHMDFGFVRGNDFRTKNEKGKMITSRDGYNSYLIIVDSYTRYAWVFLSATKEPPLNTVKTFLNRYGLTTGTQRQIRCDQGGELARSAKFRETVQSCGYSIEPTGADNSSQNGVAERPNRTYGNMMRTMLLNAGLSSKFWSYALIQAVFIKNRVPHAFHTFQKTPFEALTGRRPNLQHLKVFGSRIVAKKSSNRSAKLDDNSCKGIFLHHTSTTTISKYLDDSTNREKTTSHMVYDEAHFTQKNRPMGAQVLVNSGYNNSYIEVETSEDKDRVNEKLIVNLLSEDATMPTKATSGSAGYDLYSAHDVTIEPGEIQLVRTDISIECPAQSYGRVAPKSGITIKKRLDIRAGVIDSDYRGNVIVTVHNIGNETQNLSKGDQIAQLIIEKIVDVQITNEGEMSKTLRNKGGFGSTSECKGKPTPTTIPFESDEINGRINSFTSTTEYLYLSNDPFGPTITVPIMVRGDHATLGLQLDTRNEKGRLILSHCEKSTPSHRIKKWRSTLKGGNLIKIEGQDVTTIEDVRKHIENARNVKKEEIQLTFATEERVPIHTVHGVPQIFLDQLNNIGNILHEMKYEEEFIDIDEDEMEPYVRPKMESSNPVINKIATKKKKKTGSQFTRKQLQKREDWEVWNQSEKTQLDNYEIQGTFGPPTRKPPHANVLSLLWTYMIKSDQTKKARCVCNGNPKRKGSVTLAHTFAACLEQPGARTFWAISAMMNYIVIGADASNAFAEAPPPKAPLYVTIDEAYKEWWRAKGRGEIPPGSVMQVLHALQGHPESPRLWATMIDGILRKHVGLQPCRHEPCLYAGLFEGQPVLFLRQVDDFAVSCKDPELANKVIDKISEKLSAPMKKLGVVNRYNGVDITQTTDFIKIHLRHS